MADDEEEGGGGAPAWVVSFADMSLLLLSFFIMLLAVSSQQLATDEDLLKILASIKVGFGYKPRNEPMDDIDFAVLQILAQKQTGHELSQMQWKNPAVKGQREKAPDLLVKHKGGVGKPILFSKYAEQIDHQWVSEIEKVAEIVRHHFRMIVIQGHCSPAEAADWAGRWHWHWLRPGRMWCWAPARKRS